MQPRGMQPRGIQIAAKRPRNGSQDVAGKTCYQSSTMPGFLLKMTKSTEPLTCSRGGTCGLMPSPIRSTTRFMRWNICVWESISCSSGRAEVTRCSRGPTNSLNCASEKFQSPMRAVRLVAAVSCAQVGTKKKKRSMPAQRPHDLRKGPLLSLRLASLQESHQNHTRA
eukprot:1158688-Pelagomonas_calceolata.AAC.6